MTVDFWDVGQGDCSVITKPDGGLIVIDVGPKKSPLVSWLRERPGKFISDLFLTHNDADHIGALPALLKECVGRIGTVWLLQDGQLSGARHKTVVNLLSPLRRASMDHGVIVKTIRRGMLVWENGELGISLEVLYPSDLDAVLNFSTPNRGSAILALRHRRAGQIIWPGDNTVQRVDEVRPEEDVYLLVGPHHGAPEDCRRPNRKLFRDPATAISPSNAFISVGATNKKTHANRYSHPNPRYLAHLQNMGCAISCSGLTKWCDRNIKDRPAGHNIMNSSLRLGLRRTTLGFACRGAVRLSVDHEGFLEDDNAAEHREAVAALSHPFCLPRETWRR